MERDECPDCRKKHLQGLGTTGLAYPQPRTGSDIHQRGVKTSLEELLPAAAISFGMMRRERNYNLYFHCSSDLHVI